MVTGSGPEITRGYISGRPGPKYYFYNQFFALIPNFLSGSPYLPGNDSFIKSSRKIHETLNLNSPDSSEQKKIFSFFSIFYDFRWFSLIFSIFRYISLYFNIFSLYFHYI